MTVPSEHRAFHVMAKPTGAVCNLDCEYCFFLSKEQLYPDSTFRMSPEVHEEYLRQLFAAHGEQAEVVVAYQGGEPTLMGLDFFARSVELSERFRKPGQTISHTIQTNGTLLDDEWGAFLAEHGFLVGLSIDGPRPMHDEFRVDKGGKPTFDRVVDGWDVLRRHDVEWNALTTINAANAGHGLEVYRFLRDELGAVFIQLIPIVERMTPELLPMADSGWGVRAKDRPLYRQAGSAVTHRSISGAQYGRFLIDVFEEWARHDVGDVFVQVFDTALAHWMGYDQMGMCVHAPTCGGALAIEHTGDLYSCDHYVEPDYLLGRIGPVDALDTGAAAPAAGSRTTNAFVFTSLLTIPAFDPIGLYAVAIAAAFFTAMFLVIASDYRTAEQKEEYEETLAARERAAAVHASPAVAAASTAAMTASHHQGGGTALAVAVAELVSPLDGTVIPLDQVPDPVFAGGMLGPGVAIVPSNRIVCSPGPGTVVTAAETGHAVGLEIDGGIEVLIHVGIDTVKLAGKGFQVKVRAGDRVDVGTPLVTFDPDVVEAAGYSMATPVIVLNAGDFAVVDPVKMGPTKVGEPLIVVERE